MFLTIVLDDGVDANTRVIFLFIVIVLIILLIIFGRLSSPSYKGKVGEKKVIKKLNKLDPNIYTSFHNITLSTPDGSTQIDHVVIPQFGIFIIETKNLKGWIFGGTNQKTWTQTLYRQKYKFQNPLHQNYKHIKAVQNHLGLRDKYIFSIVVFVGNSVFMTDMPDNVIELRELPYFIKSYSDEILSSDEVVQYSNKLGISEELSLIDDQEHINNIYENKINPICPRCGKPMVIRTVKKGPKMGKEFWGCSGFPSCRATKS